MPRQLFFHIPYNVSLMIIFRVLCDNTVSGAVMCNIVTRSSVIKLSRSKTFIFPTRSHTCFRAPLNEKGRDENRKA